jgi:hypothetical protein
MIQRRHSRDPADRQAPAWPARRLAAPRRRLSSPGHGEWRSLVAHPAGGRAVAGSNPVSPTIERAANRCFSICSLSRLWPQRASKGHQTRASGSPHLGPGGRAPWMSGTERSLCRCASSGSTQTWTAGGSRPCAPTHLAGRRPANGGACLAPRSSSGTRSSRRPQWSFQLRLQSFIRHAGLKCGDLLRRRLDLRAKCRAAQPDFLCKPVDPVRNGSAGAVVADARPRVT